MHATVHTSVVRAINTTSSSPFSDTLKRFGNTDTMLNTFTVGYNYLLILLNCLST
jgi:hypothetical protein